MMLFENQPQRKNITHLAVSSYNLIPTKPEQLNLLENSQSKTKTLADTLDKINNRFGEYTITSALMFNMKEVIIDRVAFGGVKDLLP